MDLLILKRVAKLKKIIIESFKESGKKHLLLTGCKKSGKTTVLKEILKDYKSYGGITTYVVRDNEIPPKYVVLGDINNPQINGKIAVRNEDCTSLIPIEDTFENLGIDILRSYNKEDVIVIDEIGFLENTSLNYQNEIIQCFNNKNVIAVVRKNYTSFIKKLISREDVYLVDIEEY